MSIQLLGDIPDGNISTTAAWIACVMSSTSLLINWLSRRDQLRSDRDVAKDKLEHDTKVVSQQAEIEILRRQHADCEKNHAELKQEVAILRKRIDELIINYKHDRHQ